ncbi:tRNA (adenosine(37)-N6)-threonylcarbamoyltransferase complex dimerization subunit type 1 TsaB [Tsuneonella amylolytica]|uniref:tRNA (adenosine(37)-N6)-threonylcarbamoyltransferase complex dimerization subunit type 1 TsaB n=1 Tax=Tsuneonella amylolytica TaxID=2338327 RepID=UPI000EA9FBF9|nr:tRNA (adenosine(37)-N6)-threonylcarbamoyltransferase complex dimerization subunit type 1 TsaB [Tsuneonella amylolytica]
MRILAIDTASEACSVALVENMGDGPSTLVGRDHRVLGRGHAEHLVPMIAALPGKGRADVVRVSLGPGSFTGVRIGIAVARALGIAWEARVSGYPTLALLAAQAEQAVGETLVCVQGGHGEWFVQPFGPGLEPLAPVASMAPAAAVEAFSQTIVTGSRANDFVALRGFGEAIDALPDAAAAARLPETVMTDALTPIYGRAPDARLPG